MKSLINNTKNGFIANGGTIYHNKSIFYIPRPYEPFNLPRGHFEYDGEVRKIGGPVEYPYHQIPMVEFPSDYFNVYIGDNPNKATIIMSENGNDILIDKYSVASKGYCEFAYVYYHEVGHFSYINLGLNIDRKEFMETYCDKYSENILLKLGFNPSQLYWCKNVMGGSGTFHAKRFFKFKK